MSNSRVNFTEAVYAADAVIGRITVDQLDNPTPCDEWTVRELVAHMCGPLAAITHMANTGQVADPTQPVAGDDPLETWEQCRRDLLVAIDRPGATDQVGEFWFGESSINDILDFALWDPLVHSWDLATATQQRHHVSDQLVEASRAVIEPSAEMLRDSGMMAEAVGVTGTESPMEAFAAMTGRNPRG